ncbi:histidine kinase [Rhodococcus sp. APC 3903]|uniref:sensor histidine kinase n=1 Tax=Rhodococcus sp. APC 3903 TaxID=3035193 RepID=UPI0025B2BE0A|nr:histidine kinase [Rhodococcus sp. APC 3903]MDN3460874.1 histidine kinase [Rhodococcus sp. APC 3903]
MIRDPLRLPSASRRTAYVDGAVAAVCVVSALLDSAGPVGVAAGIVAAIAAALRTHLPTAALVLAVASALTQIISGEVLLLTWIAFAASTYYCASHPRCALRLGSGVVVMALCCAAGWRLTDAIAEGTALGQRPDVQILVTCIAIFAAPALVVWSFGYIGFQRRAAVAAEFRARQLDADRKRAVEQLSVEEERNSIARDIHDVVAHSLTVVIAQAEGAKYSFDSSPDAARRALEVIAQTGRASLTDVRTFLERLRHRNIPTDGRSYRESRDFLITQFRSAGMNVDHTCSGEPGDIPALVSVTLYRVLAEALTNALKYGVLTEPVQVTETWGKAVRLTVRNSVRDAARTPSSAASTSSGSGMGLGNITERVALVRGTVTVGEVSGAWELDARFPTDRTHSGNNGPEVIR